MTQEVHTFPHHVISAMQRAYKHSLIKTPQGAIFRAKTQHAVITAYRSGKVLFQGNSAKLEAKKWVQRNSESPKRAKPMNKQQPNPHSLPKDLNMKNHIGSDESGTGDYFGPVTAASVYVQEEQIDQLLQLG